MIFRTHIARHTPECSGERRRRQLLSVHDKVEGSDHPRRRCAAHRHEAPAASRDGHCPPLTEGSRRAHGGQPASPPSAVASATTLTQSQPPPRPRPDTLTPLEIVASSCRCGPRLEARLSPALTQVGVGTPVRVARWPALQRQLAYSLWSDVAQGGLLPWLTPSLRPAPTRTLTNGKRLGAVLHRMSAYPPAASTAQYSRSATVMQLTYY